MKTYLKSSVLALCVGAALAINPSASAVVVDFEDLGVAPGGQIDPISGFNSGGFHFIQGPLTNINDLHVGSPAFWGVSNGTTMLLSHGDVVVTLMNGGLFSLSSVALSGFSGVEASVTVVGTYANNTTVSQTFNLDGIIDGIGGQADFETFAFSGAFTGLQQVEFFGGAGAASNAFAIDNISTEPSSARVPDATSTFALLALALGVTAAVRRRS